MLEKATILEKLPVQYLILTNTARAFLLYTVMSSDKNNLIFTPNLRDFPQTPSPRKLLNPDRNCSSGVNFFLSNWILF